MHLPVIASVQHATPQHHLRLHPTLPLLAAVDAHRVAAHVWTWREGELFRLGSVGEPDMDRATGLETWMSPRRGPDIEWHPTRPLLAVTGFGGVQLWECPPAGGLHLARTTGVVPSKERVVEDILYWQGDAPEPVTQSRIIPRAVRPYSHAGFSPSGRSLWASASEDENSNQYVSDWFDLDDTARKSHHWRWDTDLALHPEGELMAAFESDQGATLLRFVQILNGPEGERLQTLQRAMVIDVDGYRDLAFNARGDRFLYHGNAYEDFCVVHEFPSLKRLHVLPLGSWEEAQKKLPASWHKYRWSFFESVIFAPDGDGLLVGLPDGHLVDLDLDSLRPRAHQLLFQRAVSSLRARTHDGLLAVTDFEGLLRLYQLPHSPGHADTTNRPMTKSFLASTTPTTQQAVWDDLKLTDGVRDWNDAMISTDALPEDAPAWARLGAAIREFQAMHEQPRGDDVAEGEASSISSKTDETS